MGVLFLISIISFISYKCFEPKREGEHLPSYRYICYVISYQLSEHMRRHAYLLPACLCVCVCVCTNVCVCGSIFSAPDLVYNSCLIVVNVYL